MDFTGVCERGSDLDGLIDVCEQLPYFIDVLGCSEPIGGIRGGANEVGGASLKLVGLFLGHFGTWGNLGHVTMLP